MPTPPGEISPKSMFISGARPPLDDRLSCAAFTAPVDVPVVLLAKIDDRLRPKRCSLPSMLAPAASAAGFFARASELQTTASIAPQRRVITLSRT